MFLLILKKSAKEIKISAISVIRGLKEIGCNYAAPGPLRFLRVLRG